MMERGNKKGQVTLFIILGILLVGGIVATFVLLSGVQPQVNTPEMLGPRGFIGKCVRDVVEDLIEKIALGGGEINPSFMITYNYTNYSYLCHQADKYKPCSNLHPMLRQQIEKELLENSKNDVSECFITMREDFENRGYDVIGDDISYSLELLPGEIKISLKAPITISKDSTSQNFENFNTKVNTPLYDLVETTRKIINSEVKTCYFEKIGYMILYPEYNIKSILREQSKLYIVSKRDSNIEFKFAVRGCARSAGFF